MSPVVYISIGNSDDKLTQSDWHRYYVDVNLAIHEAADKGWHIHGQWVSEPASAWQNACWAVELTDDLLVEMRLRARLKEIAYQYDQDSIAWAVAPDTEFLAPEGVGIQ